MGRGERQEWKNKCARLGVGRELIAGLPIGWNAPHWFGLRSKVREGEVMASKRIPIALALRRARQSEVPSRQDRGLQPGEAGHLVVWVYAGFGRPHRAPTRPNLALEPTLHGRPQPAAPGQACSLSLRRRPQPAAAVGSALR